MVSGSASRCAAVRVRRANRTGSQLRSPSCPAGRSVCRLLLCQSMGGLDRSRESGHGDPHRHSPPLHRYRPQLLAVWLLKKHITDAFHLYLIPVKAHAGLWPVLLSSMSIKAEEFIEKNLEDILPRLLEVNADSQVSTPDLSAHLFYIYRWCNKIYGGQKLT